MREIVNQDEPIVKTQMPLDQAVAMFQERGYEDKVRLLKYRRREYVTIYALLDEKSYFYGYMVPSTGCLRYFDLVPHPLGFVLRAPRRSTPTQLPFERESPQLDLIFLQYGAWLRTLDVADVGQLNEAIESRRIREVILVAEALHEQQIVDIAHKIAGQKNGVRLVLVSGPSSSGKTTFSKRLAIQLLARGLRPVPSAGPRARDAQRTQNHEGQRDQRHHGAPPGRCGCFRDAHGRRPPFMTKISPPGGAR